MPSNRSVSRTACDGARIFPSDAPCSCGLFCFLRKQRTCIYLEVRRSSFYLSSVCVSRLGVCAADFSLSSPSFKNARLRKRTVYFTTGVAGLMLLVCAFAYILLDTDKYGKIRSSFDKRPWRNMKSLFQRTEEEEVFTNFNTIQCPFTNNPVRGTCPICCSLTHKDGYYHGDPYVLHEFSSQIVEHEMAKEASAMDHKPVLGRIQLDTLIAYRANYLFATLSPSCKGCYYKTWCWNVGYRMTWQSAILGFNCMMCTYLFGEDIQIFYADLRAILFCMSMFFSVSTLYMLLALICTSVVFIYEHPHFMDLDAIPKFIDLKNNERVRSWVYWFADESARFGVNPTKSYWTVFYSKKEKEEQRRRR